MTRRRLSPELLSICGKTALRDVDYLAMLSSLVHLELAGVLYSLLLVYLCLGEG